MITICVSFIHCQLTFSQFTEYQHKHYTESDGILTNNIQDITSDDDGYIYFASNKGVVKYDSYRFSILYIHQGANKINRISFINTSDNHVYISGYGDQNALINPKSISFSSIVPEIEEITSLRKCDISSSLLTTTKLNKGISFGDHEILATDNGVYIINCSIQDKPSHLFPGTNVNTIYIDREHILWLSIIGRGVFSFPLINNPLRLTVINLSTSNASQLINDLTPPVMLIDQIRINGINRKDSSALFDQLWHYENDLTFHFKGISNRKLYTGDPYYTYFLIRNSGDTIIDHTDELSVSYTNLQHGKYEFFVKGGNDNGITGISPYVKFRILPHVFQTKFFYILTAIILALLAYMMTQYRINKIKSKENEKTRLKEAQLGAIRSQLNPHFVFNSLNSIQNYIFKNDPEMASEYLSKFSRLMRKSLEFTRLDKISLAEEIEFLETYIELEKLRKDDGFNYTIIVDKAINPLTIMINPLLSQPLIENSIKHAFDNNTFKGELIIKYVLTEPRMLSMIIKDNGPGIQDGSRKDPNHQSVGMQLIKDRLNLINLGSKGMPAQLRVNSNNEGTEIIIELPIEAMP